MYDFILTKQNPCRKFIRNFKLLKLIATDFSRVDNKISKICQGFWNRLTKQIF